MNELPGAKERVQFLLKHVGKEEFIFWCLKTEKTSTISDLNSEPMSSDTRLEIVQFQLDQVIKVMLYYTTCISSLKLALFRIRRVLDQEFGAKSVLLSSKAFSRMIFRF